MGRGGGGVRVRAETFTVQQGIKQKCSSTNSNMTHFFNALDELVECACRKNAILVNFGINFYKRKQKDLLNWGVTEPFRRSEA